MKTILNSKGFLLFGIWVSTFAVCISSCKDDEEDIKYVDLRYNSEDSYVLAASSPQIVEFEVSSTFPWEILSKEDWHTITPSNGVADSIYKVKITCLENTSLDDRTDTLIIKSDYWIGKKVILIQKGTAWLKASSDSLFVESVEDQHVFSIASNQDWSCEVTTGSEWLSIVDGAKGSINGDVTIKTLGNKGELRYGIITLFDRHHLETGQVVIAQNGVVLDVSQEELRALYNEQDLTFEVKSNTQWKITKSEYDVWYTIDGEGSYDGDATVVLHVKEHSGVSLRKSEITLTSVSDDESVAPVVKTLILKQAAPPVIEHTEMNSGFLGATIANGSPVFEDGDMICSGGQNRVNIWFDRLGTHSFRIKEMEAGSQPCWYMIDGWGSKELRYHINTTEGRTDISNRAELLGSWTGENVPLDISKPHTLSITNSDVNGQMKYELALDGVHFATFMSTNLPSSTRLLLYLGSNGGGRCVWDWYEYYPLIDWDE